MDVKRLVVCAASVLVCAALCTSAAWGVYTKDFSAKDDFLNGAGERVEYSEAVGGITLLKASVCVPHLWVPSAEEGIVCKVDARSGAELARYRVGPSSEGWAPVAIASDGTGAAYVACTAMDKPGRILKISAGKPTGVTSMDMNSNGAVSAVETASWGHDALVKVLAEVGKPDSAPAALAFDPMGGLWVSLWGERSVVKIDLATGLTRATVPLEGRPSDLLVDAEGFLWVLCRDTKTLGRINTMLNVLGDYYSLGDCVPTGMSIDDRGRIWIGNKLGGLVRFDIASGAVTHQELGTNNGVSAVTVDLDGEIWATVPTRNEVWRFSGEDGTLVESLGVGCGPGSLCCDIDGYVWVLNRYGGTATRIDPRTDEVVLTARRRRIQHRKWPIHGVARGNDQPKRRLAGPEVGQRRGYQPRAGRIQGRAESGSDAQRRQQAPACRDHRNP